MTVPRGGSSPAGSEPAAGPAVVEAADARAVRRSRIVVVVSVAVLALAGLALAFFVGFRLQPAAPTAAAPPTATPTATRTPAPAPTLTPLPAGPVPAGTHDWDALGGGECVDPFVSPWELEFVVVDCAAPHPAQLVARGAFPGDVAAPYPGEPALIAELDLLCTRPEVLDRAVAEQYGDLQWQASYPAGEEQWREGDRSWFCFVSRTSGQPLVGSVAAPR